MSSLKALVDELLSDEGYVSGRRRFPRTITLEDALLVVEGLQATLDQAARARAEAAAQRGQALACAAGCSGCCEEPVMVFLPEAARVALFLNRPENAATRQAFLDAYAAWRARAGDGPERLATVFATGDERAHLEAYIGEWKKRNLCAFNQGGLCTVYAVRPLVCRNAHAVGTSAHCVGDDPSGLSAIRLKVPEVDRFVEKARACVRALHHALGGPRLRPAALCEAVYALLTSDHP
jgi:hypothetical protein